ncbi:hypothetical protein T484DRAFT_1891652, partial [Baffinella frigidus]
MGKGLGGVMGDENPWDVDEGEVQEEGAMQEFRTHSGESVDGTSAVREWGGHGEEEEEEGERERLDEELMGTSRSFGEWELEEDPEAGDREADTSQLGGSPEWIWGGDYEGAGR